MRSAITLLAARILLGALFLVAGYNKITNVAGTTSYMGGKLGLPAPELMTWAVIAIELLGGLLLVIGWKTRWVAWGMAAFTVATAVIGHAFWKDPTQTTQFLKNMAIAGGFLALAMSGGG